MPDQTFASEPAVITVTLVVTALLIAVLEGIFPRRRLSAPQAMRWTSNLLLYLVSLATVRLIVPVLAVGTAMLAAERGWGLFNVVDVPFPVASMVSLLAIDLAVYVQHYLLHRVPMLWRLHLAHHTDQDYDFSTGLRFHPLEALFTVSYDVAVVALLGAPPLAVLVYAAVRIAWGVIAHANVYIPLPVDRIMRKALVTPDLHRIHHSVTPGETNSNFGGITPIWDRLFGTYVDQPAEGHQGMTIGLSDYTDVRHLRLDDILLQPFRAAAAGSGISGSLRSRD